MKLKFTTPQNPQAINQNRLIILNPLNWCNSQGAEKRKINNKINELCKQYNEYRKKKHPYSFMVPNELFPGDTENIYRDEVPQNGVYVGVGTERTLCHAYHASEIIQIDISPQIVLFNIFNTELIKASPNRETYLSLKKKILSDYDLKTLLNDIKSQTLLYDAFDNAQLKKIIPIFRGTDVSNESRLDKTTLNKIFTPSPDADTHGFNNTYLHNDAEFMRIKNLALTGNIKSYVANLNDKKSLEKCLSEHDNISVLDISNAHYSKYHLEKSGIEYLLNEKMTDQSSLLLTEFGVSKETYHLFNKDDFKQSRYGKELGFKDNNISFNPS